MHRHPMPMLNEKNACPSAPRNSSLVTLLKSGVEELWVLTVQLVVAIDQEEVCSLQLSACACKTDLANPLEREVVCERNLLHTDEVTLCNALCREVVCVVSSVQICIALDCSEVGDSWDSSSQLVSRNHPSVLELLRHSREVRI